MNGRSVSERWPARDAEGNSNDIAEITADLTETSETKPVLLHNQYPRHRPAVAIHVNEYILYVYQEQYCKYRIFR